MPNFVYFFTRMFAVGLSDRFCPTVSLSAQKYRKALLAGWTTVFRLVVNGNDQHTLLGHLCTRYKQKQFFFASIFRYFLLSIKLAPSLSNSDMVAVYCTALHCTILHCTALYCTILYCTILHCTVLYCTVLYCTVLYCTVLYYIALYCTALHYTVLCYIALYCTILYCTVLYYIALYCTILYCTVLYYTALYCTILYCTVLYYIALYCTALHWDTTQHTGLQLPWIRSSCRIVLHCKPVAVWRTGDMGSCMGVSLTG